MQPSRKRGRGGPIFSLSTTSSDSLTDVPTETTMSVTLDSSSPLNETVTTDEESRLITTKPRRAPQQYQNPQPQPQQQRRGGGGNDYCDCTDVTKERPRKAAKLTVTKPTVPIHRNGEALRKCAELCDRDEVCWAKTTGYPFWPAQIVSVDARVQREPRYKRSLSVRRKDDDTCVMYFGTQQFAWVNKAKNIVSWSLGIDRKLHKIRAGGASYERALSDAYRYASDKTFYPRKWWCEPRCFVLAASLLASIEAGAFMERCREPMVRAENQRVCWITAEDGTPWPAQVMLPKYAAKQYPDLLLDPKVRICDATRWACMMFGTGEVAVCYAGDITPLVTGILKSYHETSREPKFLAALGDLWGYLSFPRVWPSGIFAHQPWWDDRRNVESLAVSAKVAPSMPKFQLLNTSLYLPGVPKPPKTQECDILTCYCARNAPRNHSGALCDDDDCMNIASCFFCDPDLCVAGERCSNRPFSYRKKPKLSPFYTVDDRGWGLRLDQDLKKGDFIIEYVGEIIDEKRLHTRLAAKRTKPLSNYYIMEIGNGLYVDSERKGNLARFMNSSCDPNCVSQKWTEQSTGETHVGIFAGKDLPCGSELTFNYGFEDFGMLGQHKERSFSCRCGAANCSMMNEAEREHVQKLMGKKLEVLWDCGSYYTGKVVNYDTNGKRFKVRYVDGDVELLSLGVPTALKGGDDVEFRLLED